MTTMPRLNLRRFLAPFRISGKTSIMHVPRTLLNSVVCDILVRIRILWPTDPGPIPFFSDVKDAKKFIFSYNLPAGTLSSVLKIKIFDKVTILFCKHYFSPFNIFKRKEKDPCLWLMDRIRIPKPKDMRIRIPNTASKQHWLIDYNFCPLTVTLPSIFVKSVPLARTRWASYWTKPSWTSSPTSPTSSPPSGRQVNVLVYITGCGPPPLPLRVAKAGRNIWTKKLPPSSPLG